MKSVFLVLVLLALLAATLWWALYAWNSVDVEMSIHGYIAMILGIVFSAVYALTNIKMVEACVIFVKAHIWQVNWRA